jgi:hypothetical protein
LSSLKRAITQEELDKVLDAAKLANVPQSEKEGRSSRKEKNIIGGDAVGVQLEAERCFVTIVSAGGSKVRHTSINLGYEKLDACFGEIVAWLLEEEANRLPVYLTVTGKPVRYLVTKTPKLPRPVMMKAFKLQLKQAIGHESENLFFTPLSNLQNASGDTTEYVIACVDKEFREAVTQVGRQHKLKMAGWDIDIFAFYRSANFLWQRSQQQDSSRFLVILEWDNCHLLIASPQGQLVTLSLSIGMNSFMEHLVGARAQIATQGESEVGGEDVFVPSAGSDDIRVRRLLAKQAVYDVYVPFAQQVKTHLYATCNEYGISLPTHFAVLGSGASLFGITESLAADFGLKNVLTEPYFPTELAVAFGSMSQEKGALRLDLLPRGKKQVMKGLQEGLKNVRSKFQQKEFLSADQTGLPFLTPGRLGVAVAILGALASIPIVQRLQTSSELSYRKEELKKLLTRKEHIDKSKSREVEYEKRVGLQKLIEPKRILLSRAMKEIISVRPAPIKLESVSFKGQTLIVKGKAQTPLDVQNYLKAAQTLVYLSEPTPVGVTQEPHFTKFEISFRVRM